MVYSKGISWLDDTRIPFVDDSDKSNAVPFGDMSNVKIYGRNSYNESKTIFDTKQNQQGRFTPNLLVSDDVLNDGNVSEAKANLNYKWNNTNSGSDIFISRGKYTPRSDKGSNSRYYDIDIWFKELISNLVDFNKKL